MIVGKDRVQIDSARFGSLYKGTFSVTREMLDYVACLQRQIDKLSERVRELELQKEDDSK